MKNRVIIAGLIGLLSAGSLVAQTSGTATVTGANPAAVSITSVSDGTVSSTVALGTLTPAASGTLTTGSFQIRLRSNKAYVLSAQAAALTVNAGGAADGGDSIALTDLGFGVTGIANTGANVANSATRTDTVVTKFNYTGGFPTPANGLTPFAPGTNGTLADVSASTQILSGSRISARGNLATTNNFISVTFGVAALPQYFTPNTDFNTTITLTVTIP